MSGHKKTGTECRFFNNVCNTIGKTPMKLSEVIPSSDLKQGGASPLALGAHADQKAHQEDAGTG